jgi:hypothetical protein
MDVSHVRVHQDVSNPADGQQKQVNGRPDTKVNAWGTARDGWLKVLADECVVARFVCPFHNFEEIIAVRNF